VPYKKDLISYETQPNEIKHFYGFTFCLGGIFSIKGADFERINGFPSFWSWGFEDNVIYDRALVHNIHINRSQFYPILHQNIIHILDSFSKMTSLKNRTITMNKKVFDGLNTLQNIEFVWNSETNMLDVSTFACSYLPNDTSLIQNDMPKPKERLFGNMFKKIP
jgi:hypothetical protein